MARARLFPVSSPLLLSFMLFYERVRSTAVMWLLSERPVTDLPQQIHDRSQHRVRRRLSYCEVPCGMPSRHT